MANKKIIKGPQKLFAFRINDRNKRIAKQLKPILSKIIIKYLRFKNIVVKEIKVTRINTRLISFPLMVTGNGKCIHKGSLIKFVESQNLIKILDKNGKKHIFFLEKLFPN